MLIERCTLDEFHDEVRNVVRRRASVQQASDAWMHKCRQDLALGQKFTTHKLRLASAVDQLDGDFGLVLSVRAPRTKYLTHPSSAKLCNNLVGADSAANPLAGEVLLE